MRLAPCAAISILGRTRYKDHRSTTEILDQHPRSVPLVGASRGLGQAMAAEFVRKGWHVVGTVHAGSRTELNDLAQSHLDQVTIEQLDITEAEQFAALRDRLSDRNLDHPALSPIFESASSLGVPILPHPRTPALAVRSAYYLGFTPEGRSR